MKLKSILLLSSALLAFKASQGQYSVTTAGHKYVLLEEGTGTWCGYCPDGAEDIERSIEPNFPRAIVASFHNSDPMALSPDNFNNTYCGCGTCVGWPAATIDRNTFSGSVGVGRSWDSYVATDSGLAPNFDVTLNCTFNDTTGIISITVKGKTLVAQTGKYYLNAYVTEDSIASTGSYSQDNYARPACTPACNNYWQFCAPPYDTSWFWMLGDPISPSTKYSHMNVVRSVLATGASIFGDTAFTNPPVGDSFSRSYTYTIPSGQVSSRMKVIGLVQKYDAANVNDRPIENAIQSKVKLMPAVAPRVHTAGVAAVHTMMDVQLYPNPAKNSITVKGMLDNPSDTRIVIYNALGQTVVDNTYKAGGSMFGENISLNNVSNGTYFMSIINNGEAVNKQFTVTK